MYHDPVFTPLEFLHWSSLDIFYVSQNSFSRRVFSCEEGREIHLSHTTTLVMECGGKYFGDVTHHHKTFEKSHWGRVREGV